MTERGRGWIDLGSRWSELKHMAWKRHNQKRSFRSSNLWTKRDNTHFYGLCGESAIATLSGQELDSALRIDGDPGYDFKVGNTTFDVKTATFLSSPDLKEFQAKKAWADFYILVALDMDHRRARCAGWATMAQLSHAPLKNYGHGRMLSLSETRLKQLGQLSIPFCLIRPSLRPDSNVVAPSPRGRSVAVSVEGGTV